MASAAGKADVGFGSYTVHMADDLVRSHGRSCNAASCLPMISNNVTPPPPACYADPSIGFKERTALKAGDGQWKLLGAENTSVLDRMRNVLCREVDTLVVDPCNQPPH